MVVLTNWDPTRVVPKVIRDQISILPVIIPSAWDSSRRIRQLKYWFDTCKSYIVSDQNHLSSYIRIQ